MKFHSAQAEVFVPDGIPVEKALRRTTHLGIGAHQDDLEFMAFHGILHCFQTESSWFTGVTCTNGAGSSRTGRYENFTDEQMQETRRREQNLAAEIGQYSAMIQLDFPSSAVKDPANPILSKDLSAILSTSLPDVVYTHNPADKHETHIGVTTAAICALRALPLENRPSAVYGCEVWRDLDWLPDDAKVSLDVGGNDHLASALNCVFDSQIAGGKRYDLAVAGRRRANATFYQSHAVDSSESICFAMDLTPLIRDETLAISSFVDDLIQQFREDVLRKLGPDRRS